MFPVRRLSPRLLSPSMPKLYRTVTVKHPSLPQMQTKASRDAMLDMVPILSKNAMQPVGPYSQAMQTEHAIYCSGQLPADPDGTIIEGSITEKTRACLKALCAILVEAGSSMDRVVKVQIFLTNMKDFTEMNTEYEKWITHAPARSCVAVKELPKGVNIEIECIALPGARRGVR